MSKQKVSNIAYDFLFNAIITHQLKPGQAIIEQNISDLLGLSRTPIREALKALEMEGLVNCIPSKGSFVKEISEQDVEEIFEIRVMFELKALRSAIGSITNDELEKIEFMLNMANESADNKEYYESDRFLHNMLMKYSKNSIMHKFYSNIEGQFERFRIVSAMAPERLIQSKAEHMELLYALKKRDVTEAEEKLLHHLNNVKANSLKVCQKLRFGL